MVAIILHKSLTPGLKAFHAVNGRLCFVDFDIGCAKFRFIFVYMPHMDYDDAYVKAIYKQLDEVCKKGLKLHRSIFIGGDWNAVVGMRHQGDDESFVGGHGIGVRNPRGQWLVDWATSHNISIANTSYRKHFQDQWTHDNGINHRQIGFWMYRVSKGISVVNAAACEDITIGTDHRAVRLEFIITGSGKRRRKHVATSSTRRSLYGWHPKDLHDYETRVGEEFGTIISAWDVEQSSIEMEKRCKEIEFVLMDIASKCQEAIADCSRDDSDHRNALRELINTRRAARTAGEKTCQGRKQEHQEGDTRNCQGQEEN